jgi:hypothetical protein
MRAVLLSALTALTITSAAAEEDIDGANYLLPYCKLTSEQMRATNTLGAFNYGRCM